MYTNKQKFKKARKIIVTSKEYQKSYFKEVLKLLKEIEKTGTTGWLYLCHIDEGRLGDDFNIDIDNYKVLKMATKLGITWKDFKVCRKVYKTFPERTMDRPVSHCGCFESNESRKRFIKDCLKALKQ